MTATLRSVRLALNGAELAVDVEPRELLLDLLRDRLRLTGAKRSCDVQVCGTCTVLLDGLPASACCLLAAACDGRRVVTIEGLREHPDFALLQDAFLERFAVQCGFCTPGMLLATAALLAETDARDDETIRGFLHGNVCRCTGYRSLLEAIRHAAAAVPRARAQAMLDGVGGAAWPR